LNANLRLKEESLVSISALQVPESMGPSYHASIASNSMLIGYGAVPNREAGGLKIQPTCATRWCALDCRHNDRQPAPTPTEQPARNVSLEVNWRGASALGCQLSPLAGSWGFVAAAFMHGCTGKDISMGYDD
jgi:hypothetical protein